MLNELTLIVIAVISVCTGSLYFVECLVKNLSNKRLRMVDLRKEARGRECQVRLPGICNHNSETVVLAHYRMAGLNGVGMKPDDIFGAFCCSSCHDEIDRRTRKMDTEYVRLDHAEGVFRTQAILRREGKL